MPEAGDLQRCLRIVVELNVEQEWRLTPQEQQRYAERCAAYCPDMASTSAVQLRTMLCYYHTEHQLVEALTDPSHPEHAARWSEWTEQALRLLTAKCAGPLSKDGAAVSLEDLAQDAMYDLWRGLRTYRYQSRFHTWAFTVISNCFVRHHRAIQTHKRRDLTRTHSLEAMLAVGDTIYDQTTLPPDEVALNHMLSALLQQALEQHPDKRLLAIFQLWAYEEQTLRMIGLHLNLSVTRVHGLLTQAILLLREALASQDWIEAAPSQAMAAGTQDPHAPKLCDEPCTAPTQWQPSPIVVRSRT